MTRYTFTITEAKYEALKMLLLRDQNEYGALLLCGRSRHRDPWTGEVEERVLVQEVVEVDPQSFLTRTPASMEWRTDDLYQLAKRAMARDQAICVIHSHPGGSTIFSTKDDVADRESMDIIFGRMESVRPHYTAVMDSAGDLAVRAFGPDQNQPPTPVEFIRVLGNRFRFFYHGYHVGSTPEEFDRHARAFGAAAVHDFSRLRIGIVGSGGTGSAVAMLLGRLGAVRIVLIDPDWVDLTNLNRLHFSNRADAIQQRLKVDVIRDALADIGLVRSVIGLAKQADDPEAIEALLSCDLIFGCTDDHLGRNLLNRISRFYLIPVIDLGVLIEPKEHGGYDSCDGRVTVVFPGSPCQHCRQLISRNRMLEESMARTNPAQLEAYRRAGYVVGGLEPNPIVVTFTTETATMAVTELLHRLTGFRGTNGHCDERVRRFDGIKDADVVPGGRSRPDCPLCGTRKYDGRGDMIPLLDLAS